MYFHWHEFHLYYPVQNKLNKNPVRIQLMMKQIKIFAILGGIKNWEIKITFFTFSHFKKSKFIF
jgi:hypothetical protein